MSGRTYVCIDLKSFYASVECVERGLEPMTTNLVVADISRTEKTICLAVTPALKAYGIPGRARLFEVVQKTELINKEREKAAPQHRFTGESCDTAELKNNLSLKMSYLVAPPRMAHYMKCSTDIYHIYLKYIAPEDIIVYSIDEVFIDVTNYLHTYKMTAKELAMTMIQDVYENTGITATAGVGTNLYLAKIAMDIVAKRMKPNKNGVRIAYLDEQLYRKILWTHRPLTDFWRVGKGYAKKLEENRLYTMGDIARCSLTSYGEDKLYRLFGVNAELLIDHAWGWEPCTIAEVKAYKPENRSISSGQVLHCPYDFEKAWLVVCEMTEQLALDLVEKRLRTGQLVLTICYDIKNLDRTNIDGDYTDEVTTDFYGRKVPKHAHGTANIGRHTSSAVLMRKAVAELYEKIVNKKLLIRRISISANHVLQENDIQNESTFEQMELFTDYDALQRDFAREKRELEKERKLQETMIELKKRFGKNAVLKGNSLQEGATAKERNKQIGGHHA